MPSEATLARRTAPLAALTAAFLALALALAPPAPAVDEGVPDRDRHPAVGALGFDPDGAGEQPASLLCSGMVLSDRVFLTAAHCIATMPEGTAWSVTLEPGAPAAPVVRPGIVFDEFPLPFLVPSLAAPEVVVHPDHDPERRTHDLAVLRHPPGTFAGVTPVVLPRARLLDRLRHRGALRGRSFRLVGYGTDPERGEGAPVFVLEGYRQTATAPFLRLTRTRLHLQGDVRRTRRGGLCLGDSGSPQLLEGTNRAVSLLTTHEETCSGRMEAQRLDTRSERAFLDDFVDVP
jgi:hypothetical protein